MSGNDFQSSLARKWTNFVWILRGDVVRAVTRQEGKKKHRNCDCARGLETRSTEELEDKWFEKVMSSALDTQACS